MTSLFKHVENHTVVTAKIRTFSDETIHLPGKKVNTKYFGRKKLSPWCYKMKQRGRSEVKEIFYLYVFANGHSEETKGYATILFRNTHKHCKVDSRISVIDASGNERFTQTFTAIDMAKDLHIPFISRERLLSDPKDLLPNDVLTLKIDMHYAMCTFNVEIKEVKKSNESESPPKPEEVWLQTKGDSVILNLDCPLAKCLAKESSYFRRILDTPMVEQSTKCVYFHKNEINEPKLFGYVAGIVMEGNSLIVPSIRDIFDLIILADKYDIPSVNESCRDFLKLCVLDYTIDKYLEYANAYKNDVLKDLIMKEINLVSNTDIEKEIEKLENGNVRFREPNTRKWQCYYTYHEFLYFQKSNGPIVGSYETETPENPETFNFYK